MGSLRVDSVLARELLRAVEPIAVEAAMEAERLRMERVNERRHILELDLQKARYEAYHRQERTLEEKCAALGLSCADHRPRRCAASNSATSC